MKKATSKALALLLVFCLLLTVMAGCSNKTEEQPTPSETTETPAETTETPAETTETPAETPAETTEEPAGGETIQLRMIDSLANEARTAALQKIIDDYEALHENITIELISPPTEGADQKIQQMLMSQEPLDLIDTGNGFQVCINNGWVQPLNQYLANWDGLDTVSSAARTRMTNFSEDGETMWCVPYGIYQMLLFYRTDLLANAGIEAPEVWTWEDIYRIASEITDPDQGIYGWAFRGGTRGQFVYDYLMFSYLDDDTLMDNESYRAFTKDGQVVYRTEGAKEALEFYKSLYTDCSPADSIAWGFTEMVQGFMNGTCALLLQDNDVIQSCESGLDPDVWSVGNVPLGPSGYGTQSCGYGGWAMTSYTEHPQETADFLMFLSNAENNGYFCEQTGLIPIHTTTIEENEYFSSGVYGVFNQMDELDSYRIYNNWGIGYDCAATFGTDRDEYLQKYLMGEVTADDLLDYWASTWEKAVADQGELWK